jgi:hypothetical protein
MPLRDPQDRKPFADMLATVNSALSPGARELTKGVIDLYWNALQTYDLVAVRQAFDRHVKSPDAGQFMPKPADLIRMLGGTTLDAASAAWAKVERAVRRVGGHESVVFDDPLIHRAVDDMGGWPKLCETLEADLPFRQRDFVNLYRGWAMRREVPAYPGHLIGRFEAQNRLEGYKAPEPVLIGNAQDCLRVRDKGADQVMQITRADQRLLTTDGPSAQT